MKFQQSEVRLGSNTDAALLSLHLCFGTQTLENATACDWGQRQQSTQWQELLFFFFFLFFIFIQISSFFFSAAWLFITLPKIPVSQLLSKDLLWRLFMCATAENSAVRSSRGLRYAWNRKSRTLALAEGTAEPAMTKVVSAASHPPEQLLQEQQIESARGICGIGPFVAVAMGCCLLSQEGLGFRINGQFVFLTTCTLQPSRGSDHWRRSQVFDVAPKGTRLKVCPFLPAVDQHWKTSPAWCHQGQRY